MRITGARFLAPMNISVLMIQLLGRWDSAVILRYITDAPLLALTRAFIEAKKGMTLGGTKMRAIEEFTKDKNAEPRAIEDKVIDEDEIEDTNEDLQLLRSLVAEGLEAVKKQAGAATHHQVMLRASGKKKWHRLEVCRC